MKQAMTFRNPAPRMGALLVLAAALALAACDSEVNVTGPDIPVIPPPHGSVWVSATLTSISEGGSCLEARLFYDGKSIGRSYCNSDGGDDCAEMELNGFTEETAGHHTLEVQVVRQSAAEVVYTAQAELRDGPHRPAYQSLGPASEALRQGESVSFEFDLP